MRIAWLIAISVTWTIVSMADSSYVFLFASSKARAVEGVSRQKARRLLALQAFDRSQYLIGKQAISEDEFQQSRTAAELSELDLRIAAIKEKQASISYDLAISLASNARRIPLCKRQKQKDENATSKFLKRPKQTPIVFNSPAETPGSGTQIQIPDTEPPQNTPNPPVGNGNNGNENPVVPGTNPGNNPGGDGGIDPPPPPPPSGGNGGGNGNPKPKPPSKPPKLGTGGGGGGGITR